MSETERDIIVWQGSVASRKVIRWLELKGKIKSDKRCVGLRGLQRFNVA
jgi:hypothetical protein